MWTHIFKLEILFSYMLYYRLFKYCLVNKYLYTDSVGATAVTYVIVNLMNYESCILI